MSLTVFVLVFFAGAMANQEESGDGAVHLRPSIELRLLKLFYSGKSCVRFVVCFQGGSSLTQAVLVHGIGSSPETDIFPRDHICNREYC